MGLSIELEESDLRCRSEADAVRAAAVINEDPWMSPYHMRASPRSPHQPDQDWMVIIEHFQGDHWRDCEARRVWLALASHMADGATITFEGPARYRWRVLWLDGSVFEEEEVRKVSWRLTEEITAPADGEES